MEAENNLIDNIHFRRIRKSTDHMSKYYQKNQQCFYIVKMIISLSSYAYSPLFYTYPVVSTRKLFWGTESFNGGVYTWYTRILAWIIAFLWILDFFLCHIDIAYSCS